MADVFSLFNRSIGLIYLGSIGLILITPSLVLAGQLNSDKNEEKEEISLNNEVLTRIIDQDLTSWPLILSPSPYELSLSRHPVVSPFNFKVKEEFEKSWTQQALLTSSFSLLEIAPNNNDSPSVMESPLDIPEPSPRLGIILIVLWLMGAVFRKLIDIS